MRGDMSFADFLEEARNPSRPNSNAHVNYPGFQHLYVRYGKRILNREIVDGVLTIATVETKKRGKGTFKEFIRFLREKYPELNLFVENAHPQFGEGLLRMGFTRVDDDSFHEIQSNYFMPARNGEISL